METRRGEGKEYDVHVLLKEIEHRFLACPVRNLVNCTD